MGTPNNRTIIIPKGTLNTNDVNVVVVPRGLQNTTQPLIVKPVSGNKLLAYSLPIWNDDLGTRGEDEDEDEDEEEDLDLQDGREVKNTRICSVTPGGGPKILRLNSKSVTTSNTAPPQTVEVNFDAADNEGVDTNTFEAIMNQSMMMDNADQEDSFDAFNPNLNSTSNMSYAASQRARRSPAQRGAHRYGCNPCPDPYGRTY